MVTPLLLQLVMIALCLVGIPYVFLSFKKLWRLQGDEHEEERRVIVRRIAIVLGVLAVLAFLLPLTLKLGNAPQD
ncbi:MAG: hypothetical protein JNL32_13515 [Candidatus Kapabacteria bacterium]|nr:hypothetical protein [Candidatus Kapabacteria bacterium]